MVPSLRRPPLRIVAALICVTLLLAATLTAFARLLPAPAVPSLPPAPQLGSSGDPPPLTPILDPEPAEPQPSEEVVTVYAHAGSLSPPLG